MLAAVHDFIIEQGQDWERKVKWCDSSGTSKNLSSGYTATLTIRPYYGHTGAAIEKISNGAGITLASTGWNITLNLTNAETAALDFVRAVYVLEVIYTTPNPDVNSRILQGSVFLQKDSTDVEP